MKKFCVSAAIALLLVVVVAGIGWAALPRMEASGSFTSTSMIYRVTEDKFNEVINLSSTVTYTGTLEGTSTLQGALTIHRDGSADFRGSETYTGLVKGIPGMLTFEVVGKGDLYQAIQLTSTITSSTGGPASLRGVISKTGIIKDNGPVGTYTGHIDYE